MPRPQGQPGQPQGAPRQSGGESRENRDSLYVAAALLTVATELRIGSINAPGSAPPDPNLSNPNDVPLTTEVDQLFKVWYIFLLSTLSDTTNSWPSPPEAAAPPATPAAPVTTAPTQSTLPASGGTTATATAAPVQTSGVPTGALAGVLSPAVAGILNGIL
jgi:hypothetical protein